MVDSAFAAGSGVRVDGLQLFREQHFEALRRKTRQAEWDLHLFENGCNRAVESSRREEKLGSD